MTEQLKEIGRRLSGLRSIMGFSEKDLADKLNVTADELRLYEAGEKDFSFSFLHNAAVALEVDVIDLITGESPRLSTCCVVKKGEGLSIDRRAAYSYKHLAFTFRDKMAEPFLVTAEYSDTTAAPTLHSHDGQEFNLMQSGSMRFYIGEMSYDLDEGDSVYFNSGVPHAMKALNGKAATFLAVVMNG